MSEQVKVQVTAPITEGCIVVVMHDAFTTPEMAGAAMAELQRIAGHNRFMLMECPEGGAIGVLGPEDLTDALRRLAKESANAQAKS